MSRLADIPLSVLDLVPVVQGSTPAEALQRSLDLAQHAERWGYRRFWVAEHHNMRGIASAATSVVIGFLAGGTTTIRIGSGGIMLPNHAPLMIAEQFGTLESLYPGRIDLGLGRAPGTDQLTVRAIRRGLDQGGEDFPRLLAELREFLQPPAPLQAVRAVPGAGLNIPIWLLGSAGFSAQLAGELGLPFASAGHFSPDNMLPGLEIYRNSFKPSDQLAEPYAMVGINVIAADTDEEAQHLSTSHYLSVLNLVRGVPGELPPPVETVAGLASPQEHMSVMSFMRGSIIGGSATVVAALEQLANETRANEWMVHSMIYDSDARLRSYELLARNIRGMAPRE